MVDKITRTFNQRGRSVATERMARLGRAKFRRDHVVSGSSESLQQGLPYRSLVNNYCMILYLANSLTVARENPPRRDLFLEPAVTGSAAARSQLSA